MSTPVVKVAKSGVDASTSTDPNDFIFHSSYNTLKIIGKGIVDFTVPANTSADYSIDHNLEEIPFCEAFMREETIDQVVFANTLVINNLRLDAVKVDYQKIHFTINNISDIDTVAHIGYFLFEIPL